MENNKTFVVDTNVLIHRYDSIMSFKDSEIVIPIWVFEELDNLKKEEHTGRGKSSRDAIRFISNLVKHGSLQEGVKLDNGSILRVGLTHKDGFHDLDNHKADNRIILCALELKEQGRNVFFVSKDINARIKSIALGVRAVDYEKHKVNINSLYEGLREIEVSKSFIEAFKTEKESVWDGVKLMPNEFLILSANGDSTRYLGRIDRDTGKLKYVDCYMDPVLGVRSLNLRQRVALELLLDDSVQLVTMVGKAGTGKTLLALAAGLQKAVIDKVYTRVLVSRPVIPMGKDIGYLPGQKQQKMAQWMQPLFDNLEHIIEAAHLQNVKSIDQLLNNKSIEVEALTYIRGRSLPKQFIIIDEAQNLTPHEVKTIVSRAGEGTKVVLTGDPYQIDSPYLDAESNGLTCLVEAFKHQSLAGHVTLARSERSALADLATELL
jgi:PhoH-like ATPase